MARAAMLRFRLRAMAPASPVRSSAARASRMQLVARDRHARRGPQQVRDPVGHPRLERMRPGDLLLGEGRAPVGRGQVEAVRRDDPALVHRVLARVVEGDEAFVALEDGHVEPGDPIDRRLRGREGAIERAAQGLELPAAGHAREAADPDADRVDRPAAEHRDDVVADLLEGQAAFDGRPVSAATSTTLAQPRKSGAWSM